MTCFENNSPINKNDITVSILIRFSSKSLSSCDRNLTALQVQWTLNGGKCGVCGDSFTGPRDNEAPHGEFANGVIVKKYEVGQLMEIKVHLTANHKGWFEYRLCQNDDPQRTVQQSCFDQHLLADKNGETRFMIQSDMKRVSHKVQLPYGLRCRNCVLQWKYNTGNSWGNDPITGNGCMGMWSFVN